MFKFLEKYQTKGQFELKGCDALATVCNAPRGSNSGIYIIFAEKVSLETIIYVGISGRKSIEGTIVHRKDGLGGRIVNGKQFGDSRRRSWIQKMKEDGINKIIVKWYVTFGEFNQDFPRPIEKLILMWLRANTNKLPIWNKEI